MGNDENWVDVALGPEMGAWKVNEWQWFVESGVNRCSGAVRSFWYRIRMVLWLKWLGGSGLKKMEEKNVNKK
jgi:hypothetical protein